MGDGKNVDDKIEFQKPYKFTIAFENSIMDGYITEKIVQAWASGTVPIYYGGNGVEKDFNSKAHIDVTKFKSMDECIDYILYLDGHSEEYLKIAKEPIFRPGYETDLDYETKIINFFDVIFNTTDEQRYHRNSKRTMWGKMYEQRIKKSYYSIGEKIIAHIRRE